MDGYRAAESQLAGELDRAMAGQLPAGWDATLPSYTPADGAVATRDAGGKTIAALAQSVPTLVGGSADLDPSTRTMMKGKGDFESPAAPEDGQTPPTQGAAGGVWGYAGRNIHFGIREHAMTAILTGMAHHGGVVPFGATFLTFSDYMRPSIRLAALSAAHVIYVWTHDSIALGEDGPTHQPVEQLASLRAMPNLLVLRPADANETVEAWRIAMQHTAGPVGLVLTRQKLPVLDRSTLAPAAGTARGAYVLTDAGDGVAGGDPHRDRLRGVARARRAPPARRRGRPQPRRVDAVVGAVRGATPRVPPGGAAARGPREGQRRSGLAVRLGALRRAGRRDHRRRHLRRVGAGARGDGPVRFHGGARRRDGQGGARPTARCARPRPADRALIRVGKPRPTPRPAIGCTAAAGEKEGQMEQPVPPFWSVPAAEILSRLQTAPHGLSASEAGARTKRYAARRLAPKKRTDVATLLLKQFSSPIVLMLVGAAVISLFLHDPTDAAIILAIVVASGLLGFWQERGAAGAVEKLLSLVAVTSRVLRDGAQREVPQNDVVPGDVVLLAAGATAPGDCLLLEARDLFADEATLTGETFPVEKAVAVLEAATPLAKRTNTVLMGTHMVSGTATALVVAIGRDTEFGAVSERLKLRPPETDFERGLRRFGYLLLEVTLLLVIGIFAFNVYLHRPVLDSFLFSLALAVGLTPQLLPAIVSINLAHGARRMAERKVIVKRLASIENFGSMDVLCTDKTGTITEGVVTLQSVDDLSGQPSERVLLYAYLNASFETGSASPIDEAIRSHATLDISAWTEAGRGPLRLPPQAPLRARGRPRGQPDDHQGRPHPGAGGVRHRRGRGGGRGAAGQRAGADRGEVRRVQRQRPAHPRHRLQAARRRDHDRQGERGRHELPRLPPVLRPAQARHRDDHRPAARARRRPQGHHRGQRPGRRHRRQGDRARERPGALRARAGGR